MRRRAVLRSLGAAGVALTAGCAGGGRTAASPTGTWRQVTGDAANTASAPAVASLGTAWRRPLPDGVPTAPVVAAGRVVVGTSEGAVVGVSLEDGAERWRADTAGVQGAPAVTAGRAVVPGDDGRLHAFDVESGSALPPLSLGTSLRSPVTVADGMAYVVATPGRLFAVDVAAWRVEWAVDVAGRGVGKPAVAAGRVVVTEERQGGGGRVTAFDAASGDVAWRQPTAKALAGTPAVRDGVVSVAGAHQNRLPSWPTDHPPAGVLRFASADGDPRTAWPFYPPLWGHCPARFLALGGDSATVTGCNALVTYDATGEVSGASLLAQGLVTRPLATPNGVLAGDAHGRLLVATGSEKQGVARVAGRPQTPAVLDDGLVVAGGDGRLVAFGPP